MADTIDVNVAVFNLLGRARRAWDKSETASDKAQCDRLTMRAIELRDEARGLDPSHACPAWQNLDR
jgi:hypothetical protein